MSRKHRGAPNCVSKQIPETVLLGRRAWIGKVHNTEGAIHDSNYVQSEYYLYIICVATGDHGLRRGKNFGDFFPRLSYKGSKYFQYGVSTQNHLRLPIWQREKYPVSGFYAPLRLRCLQPHMGRRPRRRCRRWKPRRLGIAACVGR